MCNSIEGLQRPSLTASHTVGFKKASAHIWREIPRNILFQKSCLKLLKYTSLESAHQYQTTSDLFSSKSTHLNIENIFSKQLEKSRAMETFQENNLLIHANHLEKGGLQ
jgi:hypothetical protein